MSKKHKINNNLDIGNKEITENTLSGIQKLPCKVCLEPIPDGAQVCGHCQRHQNWTVRHFHNIGVIVSIGVLILAALQLYQAAQEREDANKAARVANEAAKEAASAQQKAEATVKELSTLRVDVEKKLSLASELANAALVNAKSAVTELSALQVNVENDLKKASELAQTALTNTNVVNQKLDSTKQDWRTAKIEDLSAQVEALNKEMRETHTLYIEKAGLYMNTPRDNTESWTIHKETQRLQEKESYLRAQKRKLEAKIESLQSQVSEEVSTEE